MRKILIALCLAASLIPALSWADDYDHLKWMTMGHSIVWGTISGMGTTSNSYRRTMYYRSRQKFGKHWDFVGTQTGGDLPTPYHDGINGVDVATYQPLLIGFLTTVYPSPSSDDCVIFGPWEGADVINSTPLSAFKASVEAMIDTINAYSPDIKIFVLTGSTRTAEDITTYRDKVIEAYNDEHALGRNIYLIDQTTNYVHAGTDNRHPDWLGYEQMGNFITDQIATLLSIPKATVPMVLQYHFSGSGSIDGTAGDVNLTGDLWHDATPRFTMSSGFLLGTGGYAFDTYINLSQTSTTCTQQVKYYQSVNGTTYYVFKQSPDHSKYLYFWLNAANQTLWVGNEYSAYAWSSAPFTCSASTWYTFDLTIGGESFTISNSGTPIIQSPLLSPPNGGYDNYTNVGFSYYPAGVSQFDDITVYGGDGSTPEPTNTPGTTSSPTYTITPTFTFTYTSTPTPTPSGTPSYTATPTYTETPTNTSTETPSFTATPTFTPTYTATPTFTPTYTATPTFTETFTAIPTYTETSTATPTYTETSTATPTFTETFTATPTATPTFTPTLTATYTYTLTPTPTPTISPTSAATQTWHPSVLTRTSTVTPTSTPTATATRTVSPTISATKTISATFTSTPSRTASSTATPTATTKNTRTDTPTNTATPTQTPRKTETSTSTPTSTNTPRNTPTVLLSRTFTPTRTPTPTSSITRTRTSTPTATATGTPTPIFTATIAYSRTSSPTFTASATRTTTKTFTPSPSITLTATISPTVTVSPTISPTVTASPDVTPTPIEWVVIKYKNFTPTPTPIVWQNDF